MTTSHSGKLILTQGPNPGQEFHLDADELSIGRDTTNHIVIASTVVSRHHARLRRQEGSVVLEDLGSSNGTFVNNARISRPTTLRSGDVVRLGQSVELRVELPVSAVVATQLEKPPQIADVQATVASASPPPELKQTVYRPPVAQPPLAGGAPQLVVEEAGGDSHTYSLTNPAYTLGRAEDNDIHIGSKIVSRHHARLERTADGYRIVPLPDVVNALSLDGRTLTEAQPLRHGQVLRIGGQDPGTLVTLRYTVPSASKAIGAVEIKFGANNVLTIGRDVGNDIRLDVPQVSRFHSQIEKVGARYRIRDMRTANGTFVNDRKIEAETWITPDDSIRIGPYRFKLGDGRLSQYDESSGLRVDVVGLNKWVRKDLNILQDISFVIHPREFVVVVGQSGGGKSTLVDAVAGYRPATHGNVYVNGIDVYQNFDAIRNEIGFVPQRDIIHMELTVFQALDYAAQLRMPSDTSKGERHQRIMEVLDDLDLTHRKDVQISGLSGGQQKRVSIGVELLTKPGLFFLDEPTSGLDPGTETALMQLMRRLADQGRTIVLITHATKNVMLADKVIFLARGGYLAWFGPPDEALKYFDQYRSERDRRASDMEFDQIYAILDDPAKGNPPEWAKRYRDHEASQKYIQQPLQARAQSPGGAVPPAASRPAPKRRQQISSLRQFMVLSSRNIKILTRDKFSLALMLAIAPLVGLLDIAVSLLLGRKPFDPAQGSIANVIITLFLLALYAIMVGALAQMREIVKEQDIYKRERLVNLKILPYVMSKIWVAALLAVYQAAAYIIIRYIAFDMPGSVVEFVLMYITLVLGTMAGMMIGLFCSALAPNNNSAPMLVIFFIIPQIVLGGALLPMPGNGQFVSALTSSRWTFENFMAISGVGSDVSNDPCWSLPDEQRESLPLDYRNANCRCMGVNLFNNDKCMFPGAQTNYDPSIDAVPPAKPADIRAAPTEPVVPEAPTPPADQTNNVAVAEYLSALERYQADVQRIQDGYKAELTAYEAEVAIYQQQLIAYQTELAQYEIARNAAIGKSEGLVEKIQDDMGWTFVDKNDLFAYAYKVLTRWAAQMFIIFLLFVGIIILQKRKDVN